MASSTWQPVIIQLAPTRPPFLLLFLLLLLSLFLALSLLYVNDLLSPSPSPSPSLSSPPLFHFLLFDTQGLLSHLLHIQQHYLAFLLSPCPIFILANLIVFTLFLSVYFSSAASSDFSDFAPQKFEYGDASLPEHSRPASHDDFFLASPPHFILSHDPPEEYHVLSFNTNCDELTYYRDVQSYNKLSNNWEKVKGVNINPHITNTTINGAIAQKDLKKPADKLMMVGKVQSAITVAVTPTYKMKVDQERVVEKGLQDNRLQEKASRSAKAAVFSSPGSQAVVINMELASASKRTRISTNTNMQLASHPPLAPLAPSQHPVKVAPLPSNTNNMSAQRPPSSPRVKKSLQSTASSANDGSYEAPKAILDGETQASKPSKPQKKKSSMVRSHSDQGLSQQDPSAEVATVLTSPSFTSRPHMQRAQSLRSSSTTNTISNVLTNEPQIMQRAQSLRGNGMRDVPNSPLHGQVTRSPSFSASLDGLSNSEANKCFSDFIAHRFALMKKELD